jgi:rhodanese-related sulfurtransferase
LPKEFAAGHLDGSRNAPGVQLVQATDEYMAVRNARVVLVDDREIRATMTASWLIQMGWQDVFVLSGGIGSQKLVSGDRMARTPGFSASNEISPRELKEQLENGLAITVIDLATSREYRKAHIPPARWAIRSRLADDLARIPTPQKFIATSPDGTLAHFAAADIKKARPGVPVEVLRGGTAAWVETGYVTEAGMAAPLSIVEDVLYKPYENNSAPEADMKAYLDWEVELVEALEKDGSLSFRRFN